MKIYPDFSRSRDLGQVLGSLFFLAPATGSWSQDLCAPENLSVIFSLLIDFPPYAG
jgi:hypothetical protein